MSYIKHSYINLYKFYCYSPINLNVFFFSFSIILKMKKKRNFPTFLSSPSKKFCKIDWEAVIKMTSPSSYKMKLWCRTRFINSRWKNDWFASAYLGTIWAKGTQIIRFGGATTSSSFSMNVKHVLILTSQNKYVSPPFHILILYEQNVTIVCATSKPELIEIVRCINSLNPHRACYLMCLTERKLLLNASVRSSVLENTFLTSVLRKTGRGASRVFTLRTKYFKNSFFMF